MICMQPLGKTRSRPWEIAGARQYHRDRTHGRRGGFGGSSRKTIGSLVVRADKTWYHSHPTTRVTLRSLESRIECRSLSQTPCGKLPTHITRRRRGGSDRFRSSCRQTGNYPEMGLGKSIATSSKPTSEELIRSHVPGYVALPDKCTHDPSGS
jgi:hypothetical protein